MISLVNASLLGDFWNKITGKVVDNETETTNETEATKETETVEPEPEPETCPASISISFDKSTYNIGEQFEVAMRVLDSQGNPLPDYVFYIKMYDDRWHTPSQEKTDSDGYVKRTGTIENLLSGTIKVLFNVYTQETSSCSKVEDNTEIEIKPQEQEPVSETESEIETGSVPTTCAASIKVTFDKELYYIGDTANILIGIFDSQGNPIPNYVFHNQIYDTRWHTPGQEKTGSDGYFRIQPKVEKEQTTLGKIKFKVYTAEYSNCNSVEDIVGVEVRERERERKQEPVQCAMGTCIPVEESPKKPIEIPEDKVFYKCNGCELEDKCYPMGYRKEGKYCSDNNEFIGQIKSTCDNNFECESNICISGECVGEGLMKKIIKWFKKLFGGDEDEGEEEPGLEMCSKLLIEKDIKDYKYKESMYGENEHMYVPILSEDGENLGTIKCCAVAYMDKENIAHGVLFCPYDDETDISNSIRWIIARERNINIVFGEYKGEKVFRDTNNQIAAWTSNEYLIAVGAGAEKDVPLPEDIADAYLKKYPSDFDLTEDDIPYVEPQPTPKPFVYCTPEDEKATQKCADGGGKPQTDGHKENDCEVYAGCV